MAALHAYDVLDTAAEPAFDALARLAAHIMRVPIALVSLVDTDRQWFKARYGLEAQETPRDVSFCGHVVATDAPLVVRSSFEDPRFADNPLVTGEPRVRFYAGFPLRTHEGLVIGTLCTIDHEPREITDDQRALLELLSQQVVDQLELRRTNRALVERQAELDTYRMFFELSLDLLCTIDETMHFEELSPAWERVLGWSREELRARPLTEITHPDDLESMMAEASRLLDQESSTVDHEIRLRHRDGQWVTLSWMVAVAGSTFFAAARDVTHEKAKARALATSENRLRSMFDAAVDAILTIDARGVVEHANSAVERLFGYSTAEIVGRNVSVLMPSPDREQHDGYLEHYRRTGERKIIGIGREVLGLRKDGSTFPADLTVSEFVIDGATHFTGMVRDITERKRVEQLQAEFVSTVSHELRTPLTSIRGALGLVAGGVTGELPAEAHEYVDIALSSCDRLVRLINDILDMEKMQSGRMDFRPTTLDLGAAVQAAIAANDAFASSHRTHLVLTSQPPEGQVFADPDRLAQVLTNLISNAAKFTAPDSSVELTVTDLGERLRVTVRDHGAGIPDEFRARIFQRFAQADASDTRQKGGTGLGLHICKAIIEEMRGQIGFEPAEGGGSAFFFELPRAPSMKSDAAGPAAQVLVCEDDPNVSRVLEKLIGAAGLRVHVAPSLARARQLLAEFRYRAVTLDLALADGDGRALIGEIRADPATRALPILVVSGRAEELGPTGLLVTDVIEKPIDETRLLNALEAAVANRSDAPRVLHVEDDADVRRIVRRSLPSRWEVVGAESLAEAEEHLQKSEFDLVLLDLSLPDGAGEELIARVGRAQVIIFSAADSSSHLSERVRAALVKTQSTPSALRETLLSVLSDHGWTSERDR